MTQLDQPISVEFIGKGPALAVGAIDHGTGHELAWVCIAKDGGASLPSRSALEAM
jgi:hypothetical protein